MSMSKTARILFLIIGVVFPIFIGLIHTYVHLSQLLTPEIEAYLQKEFVYSGKSQALWPAWGVVGFMMGISFVVIGLLNASSLRKLTATEYPPLLSIFAMLLYLAGVIFVGHEYNQSMQFYGGIFGAILTLICLFLTVKGRNASQQ